MSLIGCLIVLVLVFTTTTYLEAAMFNGRIFNQFGVNDNLLRKFSRESDQTKTSDLNADELNTSVMSNRQVSSRLPSATQKTLDRFSCLFSPSSCVQPLSRSQTEEYLQTLNKIIQEAKLNTIV
ncbi:hypothetical protein M3Y98_01127000 [Aphelenchoides besseyi]|nr:hypothetical protein M3Y98_01127000 [Aphelenchoides besseyi]KAI6210550.1 hypothetical protein M3Y96_00340100 [Aphelenchoides besseyi]